MDPLTAVTTPRRAPAFERIEILSPMSATSPSAVPLPCSVDRTLELRTADNSVRESDRDRDRATTPGCRAGRRTRPTPRGLVYLSATQSCGRAHPGRVLAPNPVDVSQHLTDVGFTLERVIEPPEPVPMILLIRRRRASRRARH
jgi:hypothetical protein